MECPKCGANVTPHDSHECVLLQPELTEEMKTLLEEYIKEHLTIHIEGDSSYLRVRLELCGKTVSQDKVELST